MSKMRSMEGEFPCRMTFLARYEPRRKSAVPEPNCGMKIRNDGVAAETRGWFSMSSAHSAWRSLRVNHALAGRERLAHGKRLAREGPRVEIAICSASDS